MTINKSKELLTEFDYVEFYAKKLREDNSFFVQQKSLIDSQLKSSISVFRNAFGTGEEFNI